MTEDNRLGLWWIQLKEENGSGREVCVHTHMHIVTQEES